MEFLYLSDSICSILGFDLRGNGADDWLEGIIERVHRLNPSNENLVFGYDEIDNDFTRAWSCYEQKYYFDALSIAFDARKKVKDGAFAAYYARQWFPYLEKRISERIKPDTFMRGVEELSFTLTTNNLDQEKLLYLMKQYEQMGETVEDQFRSADMKARTFYKLYDAAVSAFCHIGDSVNGLKYADKCREYAFYVGVDAYLFTNNKRIVCQEDCFEWDEALDAAKENVAFQEMAADMKREILKCDDTSGFIEKAKATSQLARIYALKRDMEAERLFLEALSMFEEGSANYKITQSYLLHFYADMGMRDAFEKQATDYFDNRDTYNQRYRYVMKDIEKPDAVFSNEYAMFVLIRGLYLFGKESITDTFWENLCQIFEKVEKKNHRIPDGHPWELIFKYLELLAVYRNDGAAREKFCSCRAMSLSPEGKGETILALEMYGEAEVHDLAGETAARDEVTKKLGDFLQKHFRALKDCRFSEDGDSRYRELGEYFTFMYR
jgi:hypothetical protein